MHEIEEKISFISYSLEETYNTLEKKVIDIEKIRDELGAILDDMMELNDNIIDFSRKFNYKDDYWSGSYLFRAFDEAEEGHILLQKLSNGQLQENVLNDISDKIWLSYCLWCEKFRDDFECWRDGLMSSGLYLSKNAVIYEEDNVNDTFLHIIESALQAESLYFSLDRNKSQVTLVQTKNDLIFNRRTPGLTRPIQAQQMSGRSLISVNIAAMAECTQNVLAERLANIELAVIDLQWNTIGRMYGNWQTVTRGIRESQRGNKEIEIKEQFHPVAGHLANMRTSGVGRYGDGFSGKIRNILTVVNELTRESPEKEKALALLLLRYKRGDGSALGITALKNAGINLPNDRASRDTLVAQFNKAAFLVCFQEVYRRKNQGYRIRGEEIKKVVELPFGLAVGCVLKLLADGHLRFGEVLSENSKYGVFTGVGVMSDNIGETIQKFNKLFSFFVRKYAMEEYSVYEYSERMESFNVAFTPQYFHTVLRQTDGGEADSDNDDYDVSTDKTENTREIERLISDLNLSSSKPAFD